MERVSEVASEGAKIGNGGIGNREQGELYILWVLCIPVVRVFTVPKQNEEG